MSDQNRLIFPFSAEHQAPAADLVQLLGGKGAGLASMTASGLPVPAGFTVTTEACRRFLDDGWQPEFDQAILAAIAQLETETGKAFGSPSSPLLVSVRSGAAQSMPGMMDTVLNVGMTPSTEQALAALTGDAEFAADTHCRALLSFAEVVLGAEAQVLRRARQLAQPTEVMAALAAAGHQVPSDPTEQVLAAVRAVFQSWQSDRAIHYRRIENISSDQGTAANVQAMVYGNLGSSSGTGVAFSRDPASGHRGLMGDFLARAQGEDIVAGDHATEDLLVMKTRWPQIFDQLEAMASTLELHYEDMVDIEFTVEQQTLWMLQVRRGKRSPIATFRVAIDMAEDPNFPIDKAEAVRRCESLLADPPMLAARGKGADALELVATGLGVSPGRASGILCLDVDEAVNLAEAGSPVILARRETSPSDVHGMAAASGIFTTLGGRVSHAAVVARSWGTPAVVGASEAKIEPEGIVTAGGRIEVGTLVTVDGETGQLFRGGETIEGVPLPEVAVIRSWAQSEFESASEPAAGLDPVVDSDAESSGDGSTMAHFVAFHGLRIKGMAKAESIVSMFELDPSQVESSLSTLAEQGLAKYLDNRDFWQITPEGRTAHAERLTAELASLDLSLLPYQRFLDLNLLFKQLCTDWQLRDGEPNPHDDESYDRTVIERLQALHDEAVPTIEPMAAVVSWIAPYPRRLQQALDRVLDGDARSFTGVMCDSYHDVWMELHEDLIIIQGIDRAAEGST